MVVRRHRGVLRHSLEIPRLLSGHLSVIVEHRLKVLGLAHAILSVNLLTARVLCLSAVHALILPGILCRILSLLLIAESCLEGA